MSITHKVHYMRILLLAISVFLSLGALLALAEPLPIENSQSLQSVIVKALDKHAYKRLVFYHAAFKDFRVELVEDKLYIETGTPIANTLSAIILVMKGTIKTLALNESKTGLFIRLKESHSIRKVVGKDFVGVDVVPHASPYYKSLSRAQTAPLVKKYQETASDEEGEDENVPGILPSVNSYSGVYGPIKPKAALSNESIVKEKGPILTFPFDAPVESSLFARGEYLWLVANQLKQFDIPLLIKKSQGALTQGAYIHNRDYTILRFKLNTKVFPYLEQSKDEKTVKVHLLKTPVLAGVEPEWNTNNSVLHGSSIVLDIDERVTPVRLLDPAIGDELIVFPLKNKEMRVKEKRTYPDYDIIPTAQGVVVALKADNVELTFEKDDITLAGPTNRLASNSQAKLIELQERQRLLRLKAEEELAKQRGRTLFKFSAWQKDPQLSFEENIEGLEWDVIKADWQEKLLPRLNLARFYLSNSMAYEAYGVIKIIEEFHPDAVNMNDVLLVKGASLYLMGRYSDAINAFDSVNRENFTSNHQLEWNLWRVASEFKDIRQVEVDNFIMSTRETEATEASKGEGVDLGKQSETKRLVLETSQRLLRLIKKVDGEFATTKEVEALESMARFVAAHYQEGIKRFEEKSKQLGEENFNAEKGELWWTVSGRQKNQDADIDFMKSKDAFLKFYPDRLYNDFALIALEQNIAKDDLNNAELIALNFKAEERKRLLNSLEFLKGLLLAKDGEAQRAIETWQALEDDVMDRYNRARAMFASTTLQYNNKSIDTEETIEKLKDIIVVWRGDAIELNLLKLLGQLYVSEQDYLEGLRSWRSVVTNFPGSQQALLTARKMSQTFIQLFNQGDADKLPVIDALSIYYEFRELTPIGRLGDEMISKLVDRLVKVDLLERAAALLTHQVRFRLVGKERDEASTYLAEIHFMNNNPQLAYDVLAVTDHKDMDPDIAQKRKYLTVHALIELEKNNKALALLRDDESEKASFLRAQVYWNKKVWHKVIEELQPIFRDIRREEQVLTEKQTEQLLKLAVAYAITERKKRLQILYEDFGAFIKDKKQHEILRFMTLDRGPVNHKDLDYSVGYQNIQDFLDHYIENTDVNTGSNTILSTPTG